ncbi:hypothetical protein V6N11_081337 [Hibiscus sabdariffa]|uniref:RING-type domain-containing protein n=1 Tax=Hibiscus sabdariffa TaxID=183260 RepID=A0ABR2QJQ8_9ROSI
MVTLVFFIEFDRLANQIDDLCFDYATRYCNGIDYFANYGIVKVEMLGAWPLNLCLPPCPVARRFLETHSDSITPNQNVPIKAYIEEVVDGIRMGENTECPICLESTDDPVLTLCAHRMCRECLLSSWRTLVVGLCPICRTVLKKSDIITCPTENKFRVDVEKMRSNNFTVSSMHGDMPLKERDTIMA